MPAQAAAAGGGAGTADQEKALFEVFRKFDVNGDGKIQEGEFSKLMKSLGSFTNAEIRRLFQEADTDGSGGVEWREFIRWICSGSSSNDINAPFMQSFSRLLQDEFRGEAAFIAQAGLSRQIIGHLREVNQDKAMAEDERHRARKLNKTRRTQDDTRESVRHQAGADLGIPDDYTGYRFSIPVTPEGAAGLVHHYLHHGESAPLHAKYVKYLTTEFAHAYRAKHPKPVVWTETPKPSGKLVIVGDTHGQLADVLHIFHQIGLPSSTKRYIFNGDIADRGTQALEIYMILFAFFLSDPECIIINRGNHENEDMNALDIDGGGGFYDEVMCKYGLTAYRRFITCFKVLSLCCVVEKEIFVVHGGLSRVKSMSLDYINSIEFQDCTAPPTNATQQKDQVFSDLLWSDPTDTPGKYKSERGIGIKFGPDITTKFCMQNKLRFVVRSHQLPDDGRGYRKQHEGRCVTIFSCSNYCGTAGNYGAVLVLTAQHFPKYEIYEHYAAPLEELPRLLGTVDVSVRGAEKRLTDREATSTARRQRELEKMIIAVLEQKPALWAHVIGMGIGEKMEREAWMEMMTELIEGNYPWAEGATHWELFDSNGQMGIPDFLNRWIVTMDSEKYNAFLLKAVTHVYEAILCLDMDLEKTFALFDINGDGTVDLKEVRQVLGMFDLGLTTTQLDRLTGQIFTSCAKNSGGDGQLRLNVQEFLGQLTVVYRQAEGVDDSKHGLEPWVLRAIDQIAKLIYRTPSAALIPDMDAAAAKIQSVFRARRAANVDDAAAPKAAAAPPPAEPSPPAGTPKARGPLASRSTSTAPQAKAAPAPGRPSEAEVADQTSAIPKMATLFSYLDTSGDGHLQIEEWVNGIMGLAGIETVVIDGEPINRDMMFRMAHAIDHSGNGTINYLEFLQALEPQEKGKGDLAETLSEDITTVMFRHRAAIRISCQYADEAGFGKVRAEDFEAVLQGLNSKLSRTERSLTPLQISLLVEALKTTDDGEEVVDYEAFLRSFIILDTARERAVIKHF